MDAFPQKESVDEEQCEASRLRAEELKNPKNPQKGSHAAGDTRCADDMHFCNT